MNLRLPMILAAALILGPAGAKADQTLRLSVGGGASIALPENSSAGYSWRIDRGASQGLDILKIVDAGHRPGANLPGAPGTHRWTIGALKPGRATIRFAYQRPWESAPVETRRVDIEISR